MWGACGGEWGAQRLVRKVGCEVHGMGRSVGCAVCDAVVHGALYRVCGAGCRVHRVWCMWRGVQGARCTARVARFGLLWSGLGAVRLGMARPAAGGEPAGAAALLPQRKNPAGGMPWL